MNKHNLKLVDPEYRNIVEILLKHEYDLSDGYNYYSDVAYSQEAKKYNEDYVLAILVHIAKKIIFSLKEKINEF